jgi:hypothetical protein
MTESEKSSPGIARPSLWVFALIGLIINLLSFLPEGLLFNRLWSTGVLGLIGAACFALRMRKFAPPVPYRPTFPEYLLYTAENMLLPAVFGFFWILAYFVLYWLFYLIRWLLLFALPELAWNISATDFWVTFVAATLFYLMMVLGEVIPDPNTNEKLFPSVAGMRSAYFPVYTRRKRTFITIIIIMLVILLVPVFLFLWYGWNPAILYIGLSLYVMVIATLAITPVVSLPKTAQETIEAVGSLFAIAGFEVVSNPRTQDPQIDPLLVGADYYAKKSRKHYVIDVIPKLADGEQVDYNDLFALKQASWTLGEYYKIPPEALHRQVVLVDNAPDDTLADLSVDLGIEIIQLTTEKMTGVLNLDANDSERSKTAAQLLRAPRRRLKPETALPESNSGEVKHA